MVLQIYVHFVDQCKIRSVSHCAYYATSDMSKKWASSRTGSETRSWEHFFWPCLTVNGFQGADLFERGTDNDRDVFLFGGSEPTPSPLPDAGGTAGMQGEGSCHAIPLSLHC